MPESAYVFSQDGAKRTAAAVRAVERSTLDLSDQETGRQRDLRRVVWVVITGTLSGGGKYEGKILTPPDADIAASGNASADNFGSPHDPDFGKVYIINAPEIGKTTHALSNGQVCIGTILRRQSDKTVWVAVEAYGFKSCTD